MAIAKLVGEAKIGKCFEWISSWNYRNLRGEGLIPMIFLFYWASFLYVVWKPSSPAYAASCGQLMWLKEPMRRKGAPTIQSSCHDGLTCQGHYVSMVLLLIWLIFQILLRAACILKLVHHCRTGKECQVWFGKARFNWFLYLVTGRSVLPWFLPLILPLNVWQTVVCCDGSNGVQFALHTAKNMVVLGLVQCCTHSVSLVWWRFSKVALANIIWGLDQIGR